MKLIDADEFIKKFSYAKANTVEENMMCATVRRMVKEQPTAYDVDKVVKQLDEKSFFVATSKEFYDNPQDGKNVSDVIEISDAIEIVKGGGTDAADGSVEESVVYQDFMKRSRN